MLGGGVARGSELTSDSECECVPLVSHVPLFGVARGGHLGSLRYRWMGGNIPLIRTTIVKSNGLNSTRGKNA